MSSASLGRPIGHDGDELSTVDRRRAAYRQLIDGELATSDGERVLFFVHSVDLRHASPDLIAAAGLGLALADRGYGVRLVPRHRWHLGGAADIWIATTPDADPSQAPAGSWRATTTASRTAGSSDGVTSSTHSRARGTPSSA